MIRLLSIHPIALYCSGCSLFFIILHCAISVLHDSRGRRTQACVRVRNLSAVSEICGRPPGGSGPLPQFPREDIPRTKEHHSAASPGADPPLYKGRESGTQCGLPPVRCRSATGSRGCRCPFRQPDKVYRPGGRGSSRGSDGSWQRAGTRGRIPLQQRKCFFT